MAIPITKRIDLSDDLSEITSKAKRQEAKEEIREYIIDAILDHVSNAESPVEGGKWKRELSPEYKKVKSKISGSSIANMELYGDMLDDMTADFTGNTLTVGFTKEADELSLLKAENHNKFTARAKKTKLPERNFIPRKDQTFKKDIMTDIKNIIADYLED